MPTTGDVVDQHAVPAEQDGRAHDRMRHARLAEDPLDLRLAAEVGVGRVGARVGDGHVHDPAHPASAAAWNSTRDRATATGWSTLPWANRTQ